MSNEPRHIRTLRSHHVKGGKGVIIFLVDFRFEGEGETEQEAFDDLQSKLISRFEIEKQSGFTLVPYQNATPTKYYQEADDHYLNHHGTTDHMLFTLPQQLEIMLGILLRETYICQFGIMKQEKR